MKRNKLIVVRNDSLSCVVTFISSMIFFYFAFFEATLPLIVIGINFLIITFLLSLNKYIIYTNDVDNGYFSIKVDKNKTNTFVISSTIYQINHPFIMVSDGSNTFIGIKTNKLVRELEKLGAIEGVIR